MAKVPNPTIDPATVPRNNWSAHALWDKQRPVSAYSDGRGNFSELQDVTSDQSELSQPGMAERAIDTATDVSRTITEVSAALHAAVDRLSKAIATARQPGQPLSPASA